MMSPVTYTDINFLTKMQKRANPPELELPLFNDKSPMSDSFRELKIFCIMSTDCNHTNIYALLHNHNLRSSAGNDVITYISTEFEL
jgi:hypothetical protein